MKSHSEAYKAEISRTENFNLNLKAELSKVHITVKIYFFCKLFQKNKIKYIYK